MVMRNAKVKQKALEDLKRLHRQLQGQIITRLDEFKAIWDSGSEEDIFHELVFCILTPQSKAKSCHGAVTCLIEDDILLSGNANEIAQTLKGKARFHNNKAGHIIIAREMFMNKGTIEIRHAISNNDSHFKIREWLIENIKGIGYKEASHFLRNIGLGEDLAILDRHILKNLTLFHVIEEVPASLSRRRYLEIEDNMKIFAENIKIPMAHLDLLLWYMETKEIFK
jgi:N-glycosylase/DNA lyase